jgi:beta-N-acetylhexosaminidase
MLDLPQPDAAGIIHERAYGDSVEQVISLTEQVIAGLKFAGVAPVIKHIPGHGRGRSDSHFELPEVDADLASLAAHDFKPFKHFQSESMAMTAHIVYQKIDSQRPGSISPIIINQVIRKDIGFNGLLMTDDINMHALSGTIAQRAKAALSAGVDIVLHCSGDFDEMTALLAEVSPLKGDSLERANHAQTLARQATPEIDATGLVHELDRLLAFD